MALIAPGIIAKLPKSPASLGLIMKLVASHKPFYNFEFGPLTNAIYQQIDNGTHLIVKRNDFVVGYLGWLKTTDEIAKSWQDSDGKLTSVLGGKAAAVTVLAVDDPKDTIKLIRAAKQDEPGSSVYWKRYYADGRPANIRKVLKKNSPDE